MPNPIVDASFSGFPTFNGLPYFKYDQKHPNMPHFLQTQFGPLKLDGNQLPSPFMFLGNDPNIQAPFIPFFSSKPL